VRVAPIYFFAAGSSHTPAALFPSTALSLGLAADSDLFLARSPHDTEVEQGLPFRGVAAVPGVRIHPTFSLPQRAGLDHGVYCRLFHLDGRMDRDDSSTSGRASTVPVSGAPATLCFL